MHDDEGLAPQVESILSSARDRAVPEQRMSVDPRSLHEAFEAAEREGRTPVVAEVKPTSPTADGVRDDDPVALAQAMVEGGAAALSVLTEPDHFDGSPATLREVRAAVDVPVLRKDFVLAESQLDAVEADLVLLIARFVDDLDALLAAARERGFQVLVEVHTAAEFETAIEAGADVVGINNRDLAKLEVDLSTFETVVETVDVPADVTLIAESGIADADDARRLRAAGADGLLIGSAIMDHGGAGGADAIRANTERFTTAEHEEPTSTDR